MKEEVDSRRRKVDLEDHLVQRLVEIDREEKQKAQIVRWLDLNVYFAEFVWWLVQVVLVNSVLTAIKWFKLIWKYFLKKSDL